MFFFLKSMKKLINKFRYKTIKDAAIRWIGKLSLKHSSHNTSALGFLLSCRYKKVEIRKDDIVSSKLYLKKNTEINQGRGGSRIFSGGGGVMGFQKTFEI